MSTHSEMAETPTMWIVNGTKKDAPDVGSAGITVDFLIRAFVSTAFNLMPTSVTVTDEHDVVVSSIERGKLYKVTGTVARMRKLPESSLTNSQLHPRT